MEILGYSFSGLKVLFTLAAIVASAVVAEVLLRVFERVFKSLAAKTKTTLDDRLVEAEHGPLRLLIIIPGTYLALVYFYGTYAVLERPLEFWFGLALIIGFGHLAANVVSAFMRWYANEVSGARPKADVFPIARKIVKLTVYLATAIIVLQELGVEIGPLLAGLGIAGLAVALALQSTLANFFSGVYLLSDKPVRVGDYVSIDSETSGVSGTVREIGWRTTKVQTLGNVIFVLPNEKVANSVIVNYSSSRDAGRSVIFKVGVDYESDPDKVVKLLKQAVVNAAKKNEAIVKDYKPIARFENFGDSALSFKLIFQVTSHVDRWAAEAQVKRELLDLFRKNKVSVPFPVRTVHLKR